MLSDYPVSMFKGTKSIVFSTASWVGGRNPFIGLAYIAVAALCVLLGLLFTARHLIKPRRLGDMSYLSWNQAEHSR
jgi:LEM3 (ligand-effect modulator 3) family / CDC50 family